MSQVGSDVVIGRGVDSITLVGVAKSSLVLGGFQVRMRAGRPPSLRDHTANDFTIASGATTTITHT
jgi:hypothetical protein